MWPRKRRPKRRRLLDRRLNGAAACRAVEPHQMPRHIGSMARCLHPCPSVKSVVKWIGKAIPRLFLTTDYTDHTRINRPNRMAAKRRKWRKKRSHRYSAPPKNVGLRRPVAVFRSVTGRAADSAPRRRFKPEPLAANGVARPTHWGRNAAAPSLSSDLCAVGLAKVHWHPCSNRFGGSVHPSVPIREIRG